MIIRVLRKDGSLIIWNVYVNGELAGEVRIGDGTGPDWMQAIDQEGTPISDHSSIGDAVMVVAGEYEPGEGEGGEGEGEGEPS